MNASEGCVGKENRDQHEHQRQQESREVIDSGIEDYYQTSLFDLAFIYSEINRDDLALPLWQQLAYLGNSTAQYNLGLCYAQGKGTSVDLNQARYWWQKAADQGDADARRQLSNLSGRRW